MVNSHKEIPGTASRQSYHHVQQRSAIETVKSRHSAIYCKRSSLTWQTCAALQSLSSQAPGLA